MFQSTSHRTQPSAREPTTETRGNKRAAQTQQNINITLNTDESYSWRTWQTSHISTGRKEIEAWWSSQVQTSI